VLPRSTRLYLGTVGSVALLLLATGSVSAQSDARHNPVGSSMISSIPDHRTPDAWPSRIPGTSDANADLCGLLLPGSDAATSSDCLECHRRLAHGGHPYDLDYARWGSKTAGGQLRPISEVLRRGLFLPDQQIRCVTCHDRKSPWKFHIRLPAGSPLAHTVDPQRPETYENRRPLPPPKPGDDIARKPLCLGCHALD
jgi:hypothetical protein